MFPGQQQTGVSLFVTCEDDTKHCYKLKWSLFIVDLETLPLLLQTQMIIVRSKEN